MAKLWMCMGLAFFCADIQIVLSEDLLLAASSKQELSTPESSYSVESPESAVPSPNGIGAIILTAIDVASGLSDIYDAFEKRILLTQQPTAEETSLKIVRHINDLIRPKDDPDYKNTEDTIHRALNDIRNAGTTRNLSDFEKILWRERARMIDSDIFLLMEGLLGRQVASADLMKKIKESLKCNATKISAKFNLYNELIGDGLKAVNEFAVLGQMSNLEVSRRNEDFRERYVRVLARNKAVIRECYQLQLSQMIKNDPKATSDQIAEWVGQVMSKFSLNLGGK